MNKKKAGAVLVVLLTCSPVTVDVAQRNGGFHGTLTLSEKIEAPSGAPSPTDLAAVLSIEPAEVSQVFFAGAGVPFCLDRKSTRLNSSHLGISYAVFCLKKKKK